MKHLPLALILMLSLVVACSSEEAKTEIKAETNIERVRPSATGGNTAAYFSYVNELDIADTLIAVESDIAEIAQVHLSFKTDAGLMGMKEQENVAIQAHDTLRFEEGGLHIMFMRVQKTLAPGDTVEVRLQLSRAGTVLKKLAIRTE